MSSFGIGYKCIKAMCTQGTALTWYKAKFVPDMFRPGELEMFEWVNTHVQKHHALPALETLSGKFPDIQQFPTPEPPSYYVEHLENRLYYEKINAANIESQSLLKENQGNIAGAKKALQDALAYITVHEYRMKIVNLAQEGPEMILKSYHNVMLAENVGQFGWPYMDESTGGLMPGDVVTFIGRPAAGKTWKVLYSALHNWRQGKRVLVVSMEMAPLPLVQRLTAMYTHSNISQLKVGGFSTQSYKKFSASLLQMSQENDGFFVVDGNLAASPEDVYTLAVQLKCDQVYIDGAYLMRHKNPKLDRYTRVAENAETIKRVTSEAGVPTVASYQFARTATKDKKKGELAGLDDIGYSDVIGQVSTISLGLFQDDSVETMEGRIIRVLKGRNGEIGQFKIHWNFAIMDFSQVIETPETEKGELDYI